MKSDLPRFFLNPAIPQWLKGAFFFGLPFVLLGGFVAATWLVSRFTDVFTAACLKRPHHYQRVYIGLTHFRDGVIEDAARGSISALSLLVSLSVMFAMPLEAILSVTGAIIPAKAVVPPYHGRSSSD